MYVHTCAIDICSHMHNIAIYIYCIYVFSLHVIHTYIHIYICVCVNYFINIFSLSLLSSSLPHPVWGVEISVLERGLQWQGIDTMDRSQTRAPAMRTPEDHKEVNTVTNILKTTRKSCNFSRKKGIPGMELCGKRNHQTSGES